MDEWAAGWMNGQRGGLMDNEMDQWMNGQQGG